MLEKLDGEDDTRRKEVGMREAWLGCVSELDIEVSRDSACAFLYVEGLAQRYKISVHVGLFTPFGVKLGVVGWRR